MAFSLGGLTSYVEQQRLPLLTKAVFDAKTQSLMQKRVGVKYEESLNLMDTDAVFQAASTCAWNASGTTTFSQRNISVARVKVQEELCPRSLEQYWMQTQLTQGSNYEGVPFEQAFAEQKAKQIAKNIENAIWQSTTATGASGWTGSSASLSGDANLNKTVGLLHLMEKTTASASIVSSLAGAAFSDTTIVSAFEKVYQNIPVEIISKDDIYAFCGWDTYRILANKLVGFNLYQGDLGQLGAGEMFFPGTNMRICAVNGLNSTRRIVATSLSNLFFGTDLLSDEDTFRIWASYDNDQIRFQAALKYGVQFAYPEFMVLYKASDATTPAG
jgi:hypothetical protein